MASKHELFLYIENEKAMSSSAKLKKIIERCLYRFVDNDRQNDERVAE